MAKIEEYMQDFIKENAEAIRRGREFYRSQRVEFLHNMSLLSGGAISVSLGILPSFINKTRYDIEQYKWLFIGGLALLILCAILGQIHRSFFSEWVATSGNNDVLREYENAISEKTSTFKSDYNRESRLYFLAKTIEIITPLIFVLGIGLVSSYYLSLVFNF
jgi:hypothetical protein